MRLRYKLAILICPDLKHWPERYCTLKSAIREAREVLDEFDEVAAALEWVEQSETGGWVPVSAPPGKTVWPTGIKDLREHLRGRRKIKDLELR